MRVPSFAIPLAAAVIFGLASFANADAVITAGRSTACIPLDRFTQNEKVVNDLDTIAHSKIYHGAALKRVRDFLASVMPALPDEIKKADGVAFVSSEDEHVDTWIVVFVKGKCVATFGGASKENVKALWEYADGVGPMPPKEGVKPAPKTPEV